MTPRAHVVHVLPLLEWSGAEKIVAELARRLPSFGFSTSILGLESDATDYATALRKEGISVSALHLSRRRTLACAGAIRSAVANLPRPLVVHAHMFHATLATRWALRNAVRTEAVRVVSSTHIVERRFRPWHAWMDRWTAASASCEICVSNAVRKHQQSVTGLPEEFFRVIENGIPLEQFLAIERSSNRSALTVVSVGRLDAQKNYPLLLEAWATVQQKFPSAVLKIAGRGPEEPVLKALAAQKHLRVEFLGFVEDIPKLLRESDVYVQSSDWEGFGLAVAEAMASGLPVVVTDVDSLPEIVQNEKTGLVVPSKNTVALSSSLERLMGDLELRKTLGVAARKEARIRFDAQRMAAQHCELYDRILGTKGI